MSFSCSKHAAGKRSLHARDGHPQPLPAQTALGKWKKAASSLDSEPDSQGTTLSKADKKKPNTFKGKASAASHSQGRTQSISSYDLRACCCLCFNSATTSCYTKPPQTKSRHLFSKQKVSDPLGTSWFDSALSYTRTQDITTSLPG